MKIAPRRRAVVWAVLATLLLVVTPEGSVVAQPDEVFLGVPADNVGMDFLKAWDGFQSGWKAFGEWKFMVELLSVLLLSALLAAVIAFHPKIYSKAAKLDEVEQPKILIMYSTVAAIVAEIVKVYTPMALVVFGIGGLLRFRTDVGAAKDTGRVILVTVTGLACGLDIFPLAVLGTLFGWVLIYILESRPVHRVVVKGFDQENLGKASELYRRVLQETGCRVLSEKRNFVKGQVAFVMRSPADASTEGMDEAFRAIPKELRGSADWETA